MDKLEMRVAIIGIIIDDVASSGAVNEVLHDYAAYIIGRMGIPYRERKISIISVAVDAPADIINTMAGKIGRIPNVSAKTIYSKA